MQVIALLTDLKSLSVCPHEAAVALVSVNKKNDPDVSGLDSTKKAEAVMEEDDDEKVDSKLGKADELISLYYDVKVRHLESGLDEGLLKARRDVSRVAASL